MKCPSFHINQYKLNEYTCMRPGGKQPCMRDTVHVWAGRVQRMVDDDGVPKGMKKLLEEQGINTSAIKVDDMRTVLSFHDDFQNEKTKVDHYIWRRATSVYFCLSSTVNSTPSRGSGDRLKCTYALTLISLCLALGPSSTQLWTRCQPISF